MSTSGNENPIEKAEEIIEKFGGIRPMAKKMGLAVTTVQGWKKRGVIPAARRETLLAAALANDIDLAGILDDAPPVSGAVAAGIVRDLPAVSPDDTEDTSAEEEKGEEAGGEPEKVVPAEPVETKASESKFSGSGISEEKAPETSPFSSVGAGTSVPPGFSGKVGAPDGKKAGKTMSAGAWINIVLAFLIVAGLAALFWPRVNVRRTEEDRLKALEQQVADVEEKQSFFGTLIPKDLDTQLQSLRDQAGEAREKLGQVAEKAQEISDDVLAEDAGTLEERAARLGGHLQDIAASPALAGMAERLRAWSGQREGQEQINQAVAELGAIITDMSGQMGNLGGRLQAARLQSTALNRVFDGVPASELKAAALLLGVTQFRSSLDRDNQPFAADLEVVKGLIGQDDPELMAALDRLAPSAEQGVLTPAGLGSEFKSIAGEAVVASLKGENVSLSERAKARLNGVLQVEKNGELLTGTPTQAALARTEKLLDSGDIEGAIRETRGLEGPAAETMAPWADKAEATLAAQKVDEMLGRFAGTGMAAEASTVPGPYPAQTTQRNGDEPSP